MIGPFKTIIVGGGAAGLMSAFTLLTGKNALSPQEIVVLEKNQRLRISLLAGIHSLKKSYLIKLYFWVGK